MNLKKLVMGILGPGLFSGVNLLLSVYVLYYFSAAEFGFFAFFQILIALSTSLVSATIGTPLSILKNKHKLKISDLYSFVNFSLVLSLLLSILMFCILLEVSKQIELAAYAMTAVLFSGLRNVGRFYHLANHRSKRASAIDVVYSIVALFGLLYLALIDTQTFSDLFFLVVIGHAVSLFTTGKVFALWLLRGVSRFDFTSLKLHMGVYGRWSLLGVLSTEATANSHSYILTFLLGTTAFAPVAMAMLMFRPILVLTNALVQIERPALAKLFANNELPKARRKIKSFQKISLLALLLNTVLVHVALQWGPLIFLQNKYDMKQLIVITCIWTVVIVLRTLRAPLSAATQALGNFKGLFNIYAISGLLSLALTTVLVLHYGIEVSLLGIVIAESLVLVLLVFELKETKNREIKWTQ